MLLVIGTVLQFHLGTSICNYGWYNISAVILGNTVLLKPAEDTVLTAYKLIEILEAGLPKGVICTLPGDPKKSVTI